jgi:DNA-binding LytR/AlgR family response regulator
MQTPFFVRQKRVLKKIDPAEVICLYTEGNYTKIFLTNDIYYLVRSTLSGALKKLPKDTFIRINRKMVASIYFMDQIARDQLTIEGEPVPISKQYYTSLLAQLNIIE